MTPGSRISRLFHAAVARSPGERLPFVAEACGADESLKREIESLLAADVGAAGFLDRPAADVLAHETADAARFAETRLGKYEIDALIGAGGMAEVYRARDVHLGRDVALKILPPRFADDPARLARFTREARLLASLNHPRIAAIHGLEQVDSCLFLVLELVEGQTLADRLAHGPIPIDDAVTLAAQMADALEAAHRRGIVHRDLKPTNIALTADGSVKLLDFGIAKDMAGAVTGIDGQSERNISVAGLIVGTAAYMSPEQARGRAVDQRTDVWAFGCVLYEMLTGVPAFRGDTPSDVLAAALAREPDWSALPPATPALIRGLLRRCLEKNHERRVRTMADVRVEIEQALRSPAGTAGRRTASWRPRAWAPWLLLPVVPLAGYGAWRASASVPAADAIRPVPLTSLPGVEWHPSLSPDGNYVTFMWTGPTENNGDIYVQQVGAGDPVRLTTDPRSDHNPVWSPDGRWIAFLRAPQPPHLDSAPAGTSEVRMIHPLGGPERTVRQLRTRIVGTPGFLAWCPDSSCLIATDSQGEGQPDALFVLPLDGGERRQLTYPPPTALGDCNPAVSPEGRSLVFRRVAAAGIGGIYELPLGGGLTAAGPPTRLTPDGLKAAYPAWTPDGDAIVFSANGRLWRQARHGGSRPAQLPFGEDGIMPAIGRAQPSGRIRLVYVRSFSDRNIWRVDRQAAGADGLSTPVVAIASTRVDAAASLSPDGRRVAFASDRSGDVEIWSANVDGTDASRLTALGGPVSAAPQWSPDGRHLAFQSNRDLQFEIYVVAAEGGNARRLTFDPANDHVPSFSRDGRWIYFSSTRRGRSTTHDYHVWKMPAEGGKAVQVTSVAGFRALEDPAGRHLYFNSSPGMAAIWRMPSSGGAAVKLVDRTRSSEFAVVERGLYYVDAPGGEARLRFLELASGRFATVAANIGKTGPLLSASADGRTIVYTREDALSHDLMLVDDLR
jgi:serine/threonine protein kinase